MNFVNPVDVPWKYPSKRKFQGYIISPMGVGQLYPLRYYPVPVQLVPQWG